MARGFTVAHIRGDGEFECIEPSIRPIQLYVAAKDEHIPEVERSIRTIKDAVRTTIYGLPYKFYPKIMLKHLIKHVCHLLNLFPSQNGVSSTLSPHSILTGQPTPSISDFPLQFGEYVQVHNNPNISNTNAPRTTGAIALCQANTNGGWYFLSLTTGARLTRYSWTVIPLSQDIIERVHALADDKINNLLLNDPKFEYAPGVPVSDSSSDEESNFIILPVDDEGADNDDALIPDAAPNLIVNLNSTQTSTTTKKNALDIPTGLETNREEHMNDNTSNHDVNQHDEKKH